MRRSTIISVFGAAALICAGWTVLAGKDLNFDLLNYHYYVAYELLDGRLAKDFYAASAQSYLNPLGYVAFYVLASSWHSVLAAIVLAILASASLALLFLIAWRIFAHRAPSERRVFSLLGTALGAATAVFWPMVGTSILDPWLAALVLGAVLVLAGDDLDARRALLAGGLLGAAAAFKYSNAMYGLAALVLLIGRPWRMAIVYVAGGIAAVAVFAGPWLLALLREYGNPVFPLFNAWFKSPYAPPVNLVNHRFTPTGVWEALALPVRMASTSSRVYIETAAPDIRFAALIAAGASLPFIGRRTPSGAFAAQDRRLLTFFTLATVAWIATSANARYGLPLLLLSGLLLARVVERWLSSGAARLVVALLLAVQLAMCFTASTSRWFAAEPWSRRWLSYEAPARAQRESALYLSVEPLPMAVVAPFLARESSFVNLRGHHSVPPDSPRLAALIDGHRGHLRTLGRELRIDAYDATFRRIGYRVDGSDCFTIEWRPERGDALSRWANALARRGDTTEPLSVVSCALIATPRDPAREAEERRVSALFDRIEQSCPELFRGQTAVTDALASGWARLYNGLDARLELRGEHLVFNRYYAGSFVDLGGVSDWGGTRPAACAGAPREP